MFFAQFQQLDTLIFFIVALIIAVTVHEAAHALVAYWQGDQTAKMLGRLTLDPRSHMDPIGTIMLFLVGFGWGRPVPYNPNHLKNGTVSEVLIALAGPASNIITAFILALPARIYVATNAALPEGQVYTFLAVVVTLNIFLAAFNLIPLPPLDGSKVLYLVLESFGVSRWRILSLEQYGPMILLGLIVMDRLTNTGILFGILEPIIAFLQFLVGASF
ncbi:MAG: site-2 protease family protein [Patescibacteria group bacterium]